MVFRMKLTNREIEKIWKKTFFDSDLQVFEIPEGNYESVDIDNLLPDFRTVTIDDLKSRRI